LRRYPAFDPPEYVDWSPDPEAMESFLARVPSTLPDRAVQLRLYEGMLRNRLHDIALKRWVRQGVISKAWLGTGEEAVTVGNVHALGEGDVVGPMIRNAGACHERGMPLAALLKAYLGVPDIITGGRDLHTGDPDRGIIPPTSFVAALVPVFAGLALSFRLRGEPRVAMTWVGDGARWTADFHEGMNFAAVQRLPLVIVLQDNRVALGTHGDVHARAGCDRMATAYGVEGIACDGNNVLDVHATTLRAVETCRSGDGPVILTAATFRMGGHATHDEAEARRLFDTETFAYWGKRDPIGMYETWLTGTSGIEPSTLETIEQDVIAQVDRAAGEALHSRAERTAGVSDVLRGVYADEGIPGPAPAEVRA